MARFKFKGAVYDLVDPSDLSFGEIDDLERETSFNLVESRISTGGLVWMSVRRRYPNTTWQDLEAEKLLQIEWLPDEDDALPPTSPDANGSSREDNPTMLVAPTVSGDPG